jgi:NADH dehydrogenase FAD-containing subunit
MAFPRYRGLDGMPVVQGLVRSVEPERRTLVVAAADGREQVLEWDALVIASGVTNGFWRTAKVEDEASIERGLAEDAARVAAAKRIAVVGGGAAGVSVASNLKDVWADKEVHLFHGHDRVLPSYPAKVREDVERRLVRQGVVLHSGHRAKLAPDFAGDRLEAGRLEWTNGAPPFDADLAIFTIGRQRPNTGFLPRAMLDADGFVRVDERLRVPGFEGVFAVGDVAASDPQRSSARNGGALVVAHNVRALLEGREGDMKTYTPPRHRWGSIVGPQRDGLRVYSPKGGSVRIPTWFVEKVLFPIVVRRGMYGGVRD